MRLILILLMTAVFGMTLSAMTAPDAVPATAPAATTVIPPGAFYNGQFGIDTRTPAKVWNQGLIYIGEPPKLETLEEHNRRAYGVIVPEWARCGIACPRCGKEMEKNTHICLTSYPCQYYVRCSCGYSGTCN